MLEDFTMEKKPSSRSVQTPVKGCGTEVKKGQDPTNNVGKQFPRQSRRREQPPGPKLDQNRKSCLQKQNRYCDNKRPKPRGQLYFGCGKADTQVVDELTEEFGLVATSAGGSKKQSLNHLLNFHYAPRGEHTIMSSSHHRHGVTGGSGRHYYNNSARWLMSTTKHKYNKEQFLQANCQFVVRADGDYGAYMGDPDMLVDWDMIEQVRVFSCEEVNCPICLSTPVAGKITRCGHVFCWSCMLHYLALSDKTWRKCPICYESVHRQDLKSVVVVLRATHSVGEEITFRLMKREKGSLIASPVSQYDARTMHNLLSVNEDKLDVIYSKLLTSDNDQVFAIIDKEKAELDIQVSENEGCPELCFIEQAIQLLQERKNSMMSRINQLNNDYSSDGGGNFNITACTSTQQEAQEKEPTIISDVVTDCLRSVDNNSSSTFHGEQIASIGSTSNNIKSPTDGGKNAVCSQLDGSGVFLYGDNCDRIIHCNETVYSDSLMMSPLSQDDEHTFLERFDLNNEVPSMDVVNANIDEENNKHCSEMEGSMPVSLGMVSERCRYISASSTSEGEEGAAQSTTITAEDLEILSSTPNNITTVKHFYFYQAMDGQQIYLHAVNVRMLEMTYGNLENSPPLVTGVILEKESGSMTEELRKRLRYLQHLPVTCQFEVAEICLKPPVVTTDTLEFFQEQLETRKRRREKRARDERRRERKMVEQVHRQYGRGPTPRLRIESLRHFPQCGSELATSPTLLPSINTAASDVSVSVRPASPESSRASSPVSVLSVSPSTSSPGPSFAQMLKDGKSSSWGMSWQTQPKPRPQHSSSNVAQTQYDSDNDCNSSATAPHYRQSFSDAITAAFEQASLMHDKDETENNGSCKKKKRKQKVLLFATGMACNSK
ncbi:E3 ubiquitin-protein ligase RNF10 isoform X2 [Lycorma delicatula]|uniref:E3 ubiquitin-protein ligase RNF10 isoform X2 n=1 Tax=Lycorma delicatula TaxID=130591 RepID=UPI003F511EAF